MDRFQLRLVVLFIFFATSLHAVNWSAPVVVGSAYSDQASLAVDSQGNAIAIFEFFDGDNSVCIKASQKKASQSWSTPVALTESVTITSQSLVPSVCMDAQGNAVAIWNILKDGKQVIQAATLAAGSDNWTPCTNDLSLPVNISGAASLGMDNQGNALAAWMSYEENGPSSIQAAQLIAGNSTWNSLATLKIPNFASFFDMAVDQKGNLRCIWLEYIKKGCFFSKVKVATLSSKANQWKNQRTLSSGVCVDNSQIFVDVNGNAIATWTRQNKAQQCWNIEVFRKLAGNNKWEKTQFPTTPVTDEPDSFLAFDLKGNALFVYAPLDVKGKAPFLSTQLDLDSTSWTEPKNALPPGEEVEYGAGLGADSAGNVLLIWTNPKEHLLKSVQSLAASNYDWSLPETITSIQHTTVLNGIPKCVFYPEGSVMVIYPEIVDKKDLVNTVTGQSPIRQS